MRPRYPILLFLSAALLLPFLAGCSRHPEPVRYRTEEIRCQSGGADLYGIAQIPDSGMERRPLVILSHGYGGNVRNCQDYADTLSSLGFVTYRFDFAGGGPDSRSKGRISEMSIFTEKEDLLRVIDEARSWSFVDTTQIFLLGESMGGLVSAMAAAERQKEIRGLVLLYPAFSVSDDALRNFGSLEGVPQEVEMMGMTLSRNFYTGLFDFDTYQSIAPYRGPVLILHGDEDGLVPYPYSVKAEKTYSRARLITIKGANHGFSGRFLHQAKRHVAEFLFNHTR